jgi:hypothetical protein
MCRTHGDVLARDNICLLRREKNDEKCEIYACERTVSVGLHTNVVLEQGCQIWSNLIASVAQGS